MISLGMIERPNRGVRGREMSRRIPVMRQSFTLLLDSIPARAGIVGHRKRSSSQHSRQGVEEE